MKRNVSFLCLAVLAAFLLFGACSSNDDLTSAGDETTGEEALNLDEDYGGYTTADEPVAFGESAMLDTYAEDEDVDDPIADEKEISDVIYSTDVDSTRPKVYFVRMTWGLLEYDSTATDVMDWSGSAQVNRGTLVALKSIRFEDNDFINRERDDRQVIEFTSHTTTHFDGILFAVIDNDSTDVPGSFSVTAGSYSNSLSFAELDSLELLEPVDDIYEVSIIARSKHPLRFDGGFVSGRWFKTDVNGGRFSGRWISGLGANAGFVRGMWGVNRFGNKVFKGKYISLNGEFRGLLAGQWSYERGERGGFFRGHWANRGEQVVGTVHGKFKTGRPGDGRGFFQGRYRTSHPENSED